MKNKRCLNSAWRIAQAIREAACLGERQGREKAAEGQRAGFAGRVGLELHHPHIVFAEAFDF